MRIAVAEDEKEYANELEKLLKRFAAENNTEIQLFVFQNGAELLEHFQAGWDMILLDVDMPVMNGLSTARAIRQMDSDVIIIFITNLAQYALNGYEVQAFDYMLKPVQYAGLSMKMKMAQRLLQRKKEHSLAINRDGELFCVSVSHIYYIESYGHRLCYHTMERDIEVGGVRTLNELEKELQSEGFVRCHKSILVNARYVDHIKGNLLTVAGKEIPISKNRRSEVLKELLFYAKGGAHQ